MLNLDIAVGYSARQKKWKNKKITWGKLVERLSSPKRTDETMKQYNAASKEDRSAIKDVGGYFGGYLHGGKRSPKNVTHRQLITLDIDEGYDGLWEDFTMLYGCTAVLHSTHSHTPEKPRYRLIIPLSQEVIPDQYIAISRRIAGDLGIEAFDDTTFDVNRFMYWPSVSKDAEYVFEHQEGDPLDVNEVLATYVDWADTSSWPTSTRSDVMVRSTIKRQQDPTEKDGIVGYFCRTYNIHQAIEEYLDDVYKEESDGRYTYIQGTTVAGLVVYDELFAYSHHGTDPTSGQLCNAFDLVRVHKFGHLDTQPTSKASLNEMIKLASTDRRVKKLIGKESMESAKADFQIEDYADEDTSWVEELEVNKKGEYLPNSTNLNIILQNDPALKNAFRYNEFEGRVYVFRNLPWREITGPEPIRDVDEKGVRNYIDCVYKIGSHSKINDALGIEFERQTYHPVRDYLTSLEWDGEERIDTLLVDYFGVEPGEYSRQVIRKTLCGAVARIIRPGIKFDLVMVLSGDQGTGKSTFVEKLGRGWSSDTFITVHGKEAYEQLHGTWLVEIAELAGLRKAEVESIKHFISKQSDEYRAAYGRFKQVYKRQCVFIGTTNNADFLRDSTGNRRFLPVDVNMRKATKSIFSITDQEIDQIWAEAVEMYAAGEKLYLEGEADIEAKRQQHEHTAVDERTGIVKEYLDRLLPEDWKDRDLQTRRMFFDDELGGTEGTEQRKYVCTAQIWCECLRKEKQDMTRYNTREINELMRAMPGWRQGKGTKRFSLYGTQKYYERV